MLLDLGQEMQPSAIGHPDHVGCTAVMSLIIPDTIIVANAGDSRAVLSRSGRAVALSKDHKPNLPKEAARIHKAGGFVSERRCGTRSVHRVNGKLAVSRSMGDLSFKKSVGLSATEQLVSCVPDVKTFRRQREDDFMVIACDGVWDVLTSQQVVDRVQKDLFAIRRGELQPNDVISKILQECCASDKGTDNMTMILVVFSKNTGSPVLKAHFDLLTKCLQAAPGQPAVRIPRLSAPEALSAKVHRHPAKHQESSGPFQIQ